MRFKDGRLDPDDSYITNWLGDPRGGSPRITSGRWQAGRRHPVARWCERTQARSLVPGVWPFVGGQVREFAPKGLEDSAQGFNPGNHITTRPEGAADRNLLAMLK